MCHGKSKRFIQMVVKVKMMRVKIKVKIVKMLKVKMMRKAV